jgi:hypothetical protein
MAKEIAITKPAVVSRPTRDHSPASRDRLGDICAVRSMGNGRCYGRCGKLLLGRAVSCCLELLWFISFSARDIPWNADATLVGIFLLRDKKISQFSSQDHFFILLTRLNPLESDPPLASAVAQAPNFSKLE